MYIYVYTYKYMYICIYIQVLLAFDQMRVVHEATTDYSNVIWMDWDMEHMTIITASERNIIIWDALIGSKTTT
jgi:hypothetical protein